MILQALVSYYETLAARGELPQPGWAPVKVSYVLNLDDQGDITTVVCIKEEVTRGKKKALVPQTIQLPAPVKRTVGVTATSSVTTPATSWAQTKRANPNAPWSASKPARPSTRLCWSRWRSQLPGRCCPFSTIGSRRN